MPSLEQIDQASDVPCPISERGFWDIQFSHENLKIQLLTQKEDKAESKLSNLYYLIIIIRMETKSIIHEKNVNIELFFFFTPFPTMRSRCLPSNLLFFSFSRTLTMPAYSASLVCLLLLLLCGLLGGLVLCICPSVCSCSGGHRVVDCSSRGLTKLPPGLQHNIRFLNLSFNR